MIRRAAGLALLAASAGCAPADEADAPPPPPRPDGESYLVVDADAGPDGEADLGGAVFLWNRTDGSLAPFAADPRFVDPQRALVLEDGDVLLLDLAAETPDGAGALFRIDGTTREVGAPIGFVGFDRPVGLTRGPGETVYVTDRSALPHGESRGAVFRVDLPTGEVVGAWRDHRFRAPSVLLARADGTLLLLDADARTGNGADEGVLFTIDPETGQVAEHARLVGAVSPLGLLEEPDGGLLVFDANADPRGVGGPLGAVFRVDRDGATSLVVSDHPFRDPVRGCLGEDGTVLLVDANADPAGRGPDRAGRGQNLTGGGAILALDRATGATRVALAPPEFVNPVDLVRWR
ncbi:MAG: hypothetical protein ACF8XB_00015 [Planctomycetota bacterium JB042]